MSDLSEAAPMKRLSEEWWATRTPEIRGRRCLAHRKNGAQCTKVALAAQQVCGTHGGFAPQNKAKARRRIEEAADRMAARLLQFAEAENVPAYVALAATESALDRAGVSAKTAVDVSVEVKPYEEVMQGMVGVAHISRAESRANRGLPALDRADPNGIVDAEVVDVGEMGPDSSPAGRTPGDRSDDPRDRPAFAEDPPTPGTGLMTVEDATAELRVHHARRVR